jgi:hypothetical protein
MKLSWIIALPQARTHDDSANNQSEEVFEPRAGDTHENIRCESEENVIILFKFLCKKKENKNIFFSISVILTRCKSDVTKLTHVDKKICAPIRPCQN